MLASEAWSCLVVEVVGTSVKDDRGLYTQAFPLVLTEPGIVMLENPERQQTGTQDMGGPQAFPCLWYHLILRVILHFTGEDTVAGTMGFMPPGGWTRNGDTIGSRAGMSQYLLDLFLVSTQKRGRQFHVLTSKLKFLLSLRLIAKTLLLVSPKGTNFLTLYLTDIFEV